MKKVYQCAKCGNKKASVDQISMTGTGFSRFFNVQNRIFTAVSCDNCGFTDFYKGKKSSVAKNILDFVIN